MTAPLRHTVPLLVGREREQVALRDALASALAGRGSLVLIGGEAGIGKTSLAEWLCAEAQAQGALVLVGRCYDLSETPPYGPWSEALARAPHGDGLPSPPDLGGSGVASQAALFAAVRDYLATFAARQPLVLLLEDLHWADPASLDLLRAVARDLAALPLLPLATYRADELTRRHPLYHLLPTLVREAQALRIALRPLDHAALPDLVRARYALPPHDEARLVAYLGARAEGNPFYAGELLRSLEEEGTLHHDAAIWSLGDLAGARVPSLLRQVLDVRLDRLGEDAREQLAVGAVLGQEIAIAHWAAVGGVSEDDFLETIERATEARLLAESGEGDRARFAHALIREALYEGLPSTRRRALHRRAAEALAATPIPDPDAVADHFRRAGDARAAEWLERAAERARLAYAWRMASDRLEAALAILEQRGADPGTRGWLLLRLGLLRRYISRAQSAAALASARTLADEVGDMLLAAMADYSAGLVRALVGDYLRGVTGMERAVEALEALVPLDSPTRARLRDWGLADDLDHHRGLLVNWHAWTGRFAEALALGERLAGQVVHDPIPGWIDVAFSAQHQRGLGAAYAYLGQPERATAVLERNVTTHRAAGNLGEAAGSAAVILWYVLLYYRADDLAARRRVAATIVENWSQTGEAWVSGPPDLLLGPLLVVEGRWAEVRALVPEIPPDGPADPLWTFKMVTLFLLAHYQGDRATMRALLRAELPDGPATAPGALYFIRSARLMPLAADLALDEGDSAEARAWLECHDRLLAESSSVRGLAAAQLGWSAYHRAIDDPVAARGHAERALMHATEPRQPLDLLAAHRTLGELDTAAGRHADAAAHLEAALALADACAAPYERALTLLARADLHAAAGEREPAEAILAAARATFADLGAAPALARADALAARLSAPAAARAPGALPFGLTAREAGVLALLAEGLTDPQIAERLFVSRHTVGGHVKAIYGKLGVTTRAAATRLALDHGLR